MGWTSCSAWQTKKDVVNELIADMSAYNVLAHKSTTQAWYAVVEDKATSERSIAVVLIEKRRGEYGYKDMSESMSPYVSDCPLAFFEMVPCPNEYAADFRTRCRAFHTEKAARKGKTRMYIIGVERNGEMVACLLAKPIGNSKRRFSHETLAPLYRISGTVRNLGAIYK